MRASALLSSVSLAALLALSGCLLGPNYERPTVDTPAAFRFAGPDAKDIVDTAWWEQFQDPALNELIGIALAENKDVKIAAARVDQFLGQFQTTRSLLFPQVDAGFDAERQRLSLGSTALPPASGRCSTSSRRRSRASWEIDVFGKLRRQTESARANLLASEEGRRATILTLVASVATSYINLRVARPATGDREGHHREPRRFGESVQPALQVRPGLANGCRAPPSGAPRTRSSRRRPGRRARRAGSRRSSRPASRHAPDRRSRSAAAAGCPRRSPALSVPAWRSGRISGARRRRGRRRSSACKIAWLRPEARTASSFAHFAR